MSPRSSSRTVVVVAHRGRAVFGRLEADDERLAGRGTSFRLLAAQLTAGAVVARRLLGFLLLLAYGFQTLGAAETTVRVAIVEQQLRMLLIELAPRQLVVWRMRAADPRALVPLESEPAQRFLDLGQRLGRAALGVRVLDAQDELPAALAGQQHVVERRACAADVKPACGGGGEANAGHR